MINIYGFWLQNWRKVWAVIKQSPVSCFSGGSGLRTMQCSGWFLKGQPCTRRMKGHSLGQLRGFLGSYAANASSRQVSQTYGEALGAFPTNVASVSGRDFPPISVSFMGVGLRRLTQGIVWLLWDHLYSTKRGKLSAFACFHKRFSLSSNNFNTHFQKFENTTLSFSFTLKTFLCASQVIA